MNTPTPTPTPTLVWKPYGLNFEASPTHFGEGHKIHMVALNLWGVNSITGCPWEEFPAVGAPYGGLTDDELLAEGIKEYRADGGAILGTATYTVHLGLWRRVND